MPSETDSARPDLIYLNGVTLKGQYLTPPVTAEELLALAQEERKGIPKEDQDFTKALSEIKNEPTLGFNANLENLADARWGVVFATGEDAAIKDAIEPLVKHRADQLGFTPPVFECRPDWSVAQFLAANEVERGFGDVQKVPYYLLLVGSPDKIPFRFQYELDGEYAVGRLAFDQVEDYAAYVAQLIDYEKADSVPNGREVVFWAPANVDDRATGMSSELLAKPLCEGLDPKLGFNSQLFQGKDATKANLAAAYAGAKPPALVFSASHGLGFEQSDPEQFALQGALVTQDWTPGSDIGKDQLFSGSDVKAGIQPRGVVHFAFACYGAGTPRQDDFSHGKGKIAPVIADKPFVADLPKELLLKGGLAFLGHVERAWGYSFIGATDKPMQTGFDRAIHRLLSGVPIGQALRDQHDRGVQLSSSLLEDLNEMDYGKKIPALVIANKWVQRNDARAFILVGDPGAHLRVKDMQ